MTLLLILLAVLWLACPILCYAMDLAYFQGRYPVLAKERLCQDKMEALVSGAFGLLLGPIGVMVAFIMFDFAKHGLRFK